LNEECELFVTTAFLLIGQNIVMMICLLLVEYLEPELMRAKSYERIDNIVANHPRDKMDLEILSNLL